jgi:hypothetical protein
MELMETLGSRHHAGDVARAVALGKQARDTFLVRDGYASEIGRIDRFLAQHALAAHAAPR